MACKCFGGFREYPGVCKDFGGLRCLGRVPSVCEGSGGTQGFRGAPAKEGGERGSHQRGGSSPRPTAAPRGHRGGARAPTRPPPAAPAPWPWGLWGDPRGKQEFVQPQGSGVPHLGILGAWGVLGLGVSPATRGSRGSRLKKPVLGKKKIPKFGSGRQNHREGRESSRAIERNPLGQRRPPPPPPITAVPRCVHKAATLRGADPRLAAVPRCVHKAATLRGAELSPCCGDRPGGQKAKRVPIVKKILLNECPRKPWPKLKLTNKNEKKTPFDIYKKSRIFFHIYIHNVYILNIQ